MNLAALMNIKGGQIERPKAKHPEDIKLLSSNDADMVKKVDTMARPK